MPKASEQVSAIFTGFDPFGPYPVNPSIDAAAGAAEAWAGPASTRTLPVTWDGCLDGVEQIAATRPAVVVHFGLAADRKPVCIEAVARNRSGATKDNAGRPGGGPLLDGAPDVRAPRAGLAERVALDASAWSPVALNVSTDAGDYICNATYFAALGHPALADATVLFVHIPAVGAREARAIGAAIARALAPLI